MAGKVDAAKNKFFASIDYLPQGERFQPIEQEALYQLLTSNLFRRAATFAYQEIKGKMIGMLRADLTNPQGVADTLRKQGEAAGFTRAYEALFDLLEDINEPAEEDEK